MTAMLSPSLRYPIRQFFDSHIQSVSGGRHPESPQRTLQLATASLLIEVVRADFHVAVEERHAITHAIQQMFKLSETQSGREHVAD